MLEDLRNGYWFLTGMLLVCIMLLAILLACCVAAARPEYEWAELRLPCGEVVSGEVQELTISGGHAAVVIDGVAYLVGLNNIVFVNRP